MAVLSFIYLFISRMNGLQAGEQQGCNLFLDSPSGGMDVLSVWVIFEHKLFQNAVGDFRQSAEMSALTSGWNDVTNWGQKSENLQNVIKYFHQFITKKAEPFNFLFKTEQTFSLVLSTSRTGFQIYGT